MTITKEKQTKEKQKKEPQKTKAQLRNESLPLTGGIDTIDAAITTMPKGVYVVTAAQNNTDVDMAFFNALLTYAQYHDAKLLIAKITYNKRGFQQPSLDDDDCFYAKELTPYLVEGQIDLGGVHFCANANVIPTAKNPLSGFESITKAGIDIIIPASKIALKCVAALKHSTPKRMFSTGTVTKMNYILRKAGATAATEHNIGALVVDTRGDTPIVRQLEQMEGYNGFWDECNYYQGGNVIERPKTEIAIQLGDIHAEKMDNDNLYKIQKMLAFYTPSHLILHDVLDFSSRNHHNIKDCAFIFKQDNEGQSVKNDICVVGDCIETLASYADNVHVIESNHDLALVTWLKNSDFKKDSVNAITYLELMLEMYQGINETGNEPNMLQTAIEKYTDFGKQMDNVTFHNVDDSVMINGVECGLHGHTGINGARGAPVQFRTLGIPLNTGHTHSPSITGKCYTAGVSAALEMGYNKGASSWFIAHIVTYENGQRQVIFS